MLVTAPVLQDTLVEFLSMFGTLAQVDPTRFCHISGWGRHTDSCPIPRASGSGRPGSRGHTSAAGSPSSAQGVGNSFRGGSSQAREVQEVTPSFLQFLGIRGCPRISCGVPRILCTMGIA